MQPSTGRYREADNLPECNRGNHFASGFGIRPEMTDPRTEPPRFRIYALAIAIGLIVAAAGIMPWVVLARANATLRPDVPWAAVATILYLAALLAWLNGAGPPRRHSEWRRSHLRLWLTQAGDHTEVPDVRSKLAEAVPFVFGLLGLTMIWILVAGKSEPPDLSAYPTTAYRLSIFFVGPLVSGVVEEAAYRGYMQRGLEPLGLEKAIIVTSLVFTLAHAVHGLTNLLLVGPGFFVASVLYGFLAARTGTIVPGMIIHTLGDLAYTYFGILRGDGRLLFVAG